MPLTSVSSLRHCFCQTLSSLSSSPLMMPLSPPVSTFIRVLFLAQMMLLLPQKYLFIFFFSPYTCLPSLDHVSCCLSQQLFCQFETRSARVLCFFVWLGFRSFCLTWMLSFEAVMLDRSFQTGIRPTVYRAAVRFSHLKISRASSAILSPRGSFLCCCCFPQISDPLQLLLPSTNCSSLIN